MYACIKNSYMREREIVEPCLFEPLGPGCVHNSEFSGSSSQASY